MQNNRSNSRSNNIKDRPIFIAIRNGDMEMIKRLIGKGVKLNANTRSSCNLSELQDAIFFIDDKELRYKIVKYLIDNGAEVNRRDEFGNAPLHFAVLDNDLKVVRLLVDEGACVHFEGMNKLTPLGLASVHNAYEIAMFLLSKDSTTIDRGRIKLVTLTAKKGLGSMLKLLLCHGVRVNFTSVFEVISRCSFEMTKLVLDYAYVETIQDTKLKHLKNWFILYIGVVFFEYKTVDYILDNTNADINFFDNDYDIKLQLPLEAILEEESTAETHHRKKEFEITVKVLIRHLAILSAQNGFVCKENMDLVRKNTWMVDYYESCCKELEKMKKTKVCEDFSVTYFDLVTKRSTELSSILRLQKIIKVLQFDIYEKMFPLCFDKIKSKFQDGLEKLRKMIEFEKVLRNTVGLVLQNDLVIRMISEYYNYRDFALCVENF